MSDVVAAADALARLIAQLEAATGPARELDCAIADYHVGKERRAIGGDARYTASIDAALTLVPRDPANKTRPMLWSVAYDEDGVGGVRSFTAALGKGYHDPQYIYGHHETAPALALCIAALRARAEGEAAGSKQGVEAAAADDLIARLKTITGPAYIQELLTEAVTMLKALTAVCARQPEILEWLEERIGTDWTCTNCNYSTYHAMAKECARCGTEFPLEHIVAFKLALSPASPIPTYADGDDAGFKRGVEAAAKRIEQIQSHSFPKESRDHQYALTCAVAAVRSLALSPAAAPEPVNKLYDAGFAAGRAQGVEAARAAMREVLMAKGFAETLTSCVDAFNNRIALAPASASDPPLTPTGEALAKAVDSLLAADKAYQDCVNEFEPDEASACAERLDILWNAICRLRRVREGPLS